MKSVLSSSGYEFNQEFQIWQRPGFGGIDYCDGDEIENRIYSAIRGCTDLTLFSEELAHHCTDWPSLYHLSPLRANILRPFESLLSGDVLEIGAGCGAITRYIGESGGTILALEGSPRRAAIARARTRDLANITVVSENFEHFACEKKFDVIVMIGVLEYASLFISADEPAVSMLHLVGGLLKPTGRLILAIENQYGLKYFAGAPEDHLNVPMYGIEDRYRIGQPTTFGKKTLTDKLTHAGFRAIEFLAPFPDYKLPTSIVSQSGFVSTDFDATAFAWQTVHSDVQLPPTLSFSPTLAWPSVIENGLGLELANSFLVVAGREETGCVDKADLAWHFSTGRKKQFCKTTLFRRDTSGEIEVTYQPLFSGVSANDSQSLLIQELPEKAVYSEGKNLSWRIVQLLSTQGWRIKDVAEFFHFYFGCLHQIVASKGGVFVPNSHDSKAPGFLFDCLPQNLLVREDGTTTFIDQEWIATVPLEAGYLLMRAIMQPSFNFGAHPQGDSSNFDGTRLGLIQAISMELGWSLSKEKVYEYAELEVQRLQQVQTQPPTLTEYLHWLTTPERIRMNLAQMLSDNQSEHIKCSKLSEARLQEYANTIGELEKKIIGLDQQKNELQNSISKKSEIITELEYKMDAANAKLQSILSSRSWKVTHSVRELARHLRGFTGVLRLIRLEVIQHGVDGSARRALRLLRNTGVKGAYKRVVTRSVQHSLGDNTRFNNQTIPTADHFNIVPYYIDPLLDTRPAISLPSFSLAVHLHLFYPEMQDSLCKRLANITQNFDLYVSVPNGSDTKTITERFRLLLPSAQLIAVEEVPNRGRDIAPMIVQFGKRLLEYDIIGHFHTKKSPHDQNLADWLDDILDLLLGRQGATGGAISHIFHKLLTTAKVVYPEGRRHIIQDRGRWGENYDRAREVLQKYSTLSIDSFPEVEFPEGSMFWARGKSLGDMLQLPLSFNDFPLEPIPADGTLAHALERLILIFASPHQGHNLRIHRRDSVQDYRFYEPQEDFRAHLVHSDIRVLSYYLPQFHPIPENDAWHGEGFTEWTKVRSASPLFRGHYQQHIPHPDLGYYHLDSEDTLRKQAAMMEKAGVYGQVFYHYWFQGKLILEQPAHLLLKAQDITMPFCFCWANENWTRRWDGNEAEVLLAQNYSDSDARAFISYLIPFFKDSRYIRIEDRPLLFVYRPSSIPDSKSYVSIWAEECGKHGIPAPYVTAVLTRGATSPIPFGMDAGVERVLHDWTAGAVTDIKKNLHKYAPLNGSVLPYGDVARFYESQQEAPDFTYFRSIIPTWDNTARYGSEGYIIHGSSPELFQNWFTKLIEYSKANLPSDRRFILVNAWNEWAEGAHLEPDSRFGFSYLNSIGRALSDIPYSASANTTETEKKTAAIHLVIPPYFEDMLRSKGSFAARMYQTIVRSSLFERYNVTVDQSLKIEIPRTRIGERKNADFLLEFRRPAFFTPDTIEKMVQLGLSRPESVIIPNYYGSDSLVEVENNGSAHSHDAFSAPFVLYPVVIPDGGYKNFRMCLNAPCFLTHHHTQHDSELPVVTTIIRFHKSGDLDLLRSALGCLSAMQNCICVPQIAAQDLSAFEKESLIALLDEFVWQPNYAPVINYYQSTDGNTDLRSKMLNDSLQKASSRYVAFLDYDDLLMPNAYGWLIERLVKTGKAVSFGRVYSTQFNHSTKVLLNRSRAFEYGYCYEDFISANHAPLHSFILDRQRFNLKSIKYHDVHPYEEDYFLTLQLFTKENADWESLHFNHYIGDYLHSIDRSHTLAFTNDSERANIFTNPEYVNCKKRLLELREEILGSKGREKLTA